VREEDAAGVPESVMLTTTGRRERGEAKFWQGMNLPENMTTIQRKEEENGDDETDEEGVSSSFGVARIVLFDRCSSPGWNI
jgi:hypothetical protein